MIYPRIFAGPFSDLELEPDPDAAREFPGAGSMVRFGNPLFSYVDAGAGTAKTDPKAPEPRDWPEFPEDADCESWNPFCGSITRGPDPDEPKDPEPGPELPPDGSPPDGLPPDVPEDRPGFDYPDFPWPGLPPRDGLPPGPAPIPPMDFPPPDVPVPPDFPDPHKPGGDQPDCIPQPERDLAYLEIFYSGNTCHMERAFGRAHDEANGQARQYFGQCPGGTVVVYPWSVYGRTHSLRVLNPSQWGVGHALHTEADCTDFENKTITFRVVCKPPCKREP